MSRLVGSVHNEAALIRALKCEFGSGRLIVLADKASYYGGLRSGGKEGARDARARCEQAVAMYYTVPGQQILR